jgi:predicted HAD superfamily Cof-like phosphohydrolase
MSAVDDVEDFHRVTDTPVLLVPEWPADERVDLRVALIVEEVVRELLTAIAKRDMVGTSNGIVDGIYVLIGAAHEFGVPIEAEWAAVQLSNMQKAVEQPDGTLRVIRRPDGKILKPEGWTPPDTEGILRAHGWKG